MANFLQSHSRVITAARDLRCRLEKSGHAHVVVFLRENGEEIFILPAERLDAPTLQKLRDQKVRCALDGPSDDGTSAISVRADSGELLFQQNVWIRAAAWNRLVRDA